MERKDIVARFLKDGHQLDASALDYFMTRPAEIEEFVQTLNKTTTIHPPTVTLDLVRDILKKEEPTIKIIKKFFIKPKKEKIPISDYSNKLVKHYEWKKQLLIDRVDSTKLLSINKIQKQSEFVLIVMVGERDRVEKSVVVEDLTGNTTVYFENMKEYEGLFENDVAGLVCGMNAEGIKVKNVVWPDVPLKRSVNKTKENICCLFISDFHIDSKQFNKERYKKFVRCVEEIERDRKYGKIYVFILGGISQKKSDVEELFNTLPKNSFKIFLRSKKDAAVDKREDLLSSAAPMMIEIEGIKFLLIRGDELRPYRKYCGENAPDAIKNILKRRDLAPINTGEAFVPLKDTLLDQVPDIFASAGLHSASATNYKGTTIITTGGLAEEPVFWTADLKTRGINKLSFS